LVKPQITMKQKLLIYTLFLSVSSLVAQVGIGTTSPKSQLDISATSISAPTNTDGLLIPRLSDFPATNPGADQNGMLVFLATASGSNPIGFYYWSNPQTKWIGLTTGQTGWSLTGNTTTIDGTNFLGTTDDVPLNFRIHNTKAGRISKTQTFYGYQAGNVNTSNNNVALGTQALLNATNSNSTAVGYRALYTSVTGNQNTAVGYEALHNGTNNDNTALGFRALRNTTTGNSNTALGKDAMLNTTTGNENVAIGKDVMLFNTTGYENVAIGREAMRVNTTGGQNTAVGKNALASNTTSIQNTAVGKNAMIANTTGEKNTGIGSEALNNNTTGSYNTAIGFAAMYDSQGGHRNTALGYEALRNSKADGNVGIGFNTMRLTNTGTYNTAIGYSTLYNNTSGSENIALGHDALDENTSGSNNIALGRWAFNTNATGSNNVIIGYDADATVTGLTNAIAIGSGVRIGVSNKIRLGNTAITVVEAQVALSTTSDRRYKEEIATLPLGLDFINQIRPVEYVRKSNADNTKEWGVIAQELQQVLADTGYDGAGLISEDGSEEHYLSVRYTDLIAPMIKAIQELTEKDKEIQNLKKQVEAQDAKYDALLKRIEALEKAIN